MAGLVRLITALLLGALLLPVAPGGFARAERIRLGEGAAVEVCFTPAEDCAGVIAGRLAAARRSVWVQAYRLSAPPIVDSLNAAHRRGLDVRVLLDRSAHAGSGVAALIAAGVPVGFDERVRIAHDKVFVIDGAIVVTGSLNATMAARRNAENVLIIEDPALAERYAQNWRRRAQGARAAGP